MGNFTAVVIISIISQMLSIQLAYASGLNASVVDDLDHTISTSNVTHFPRVASVSTFGAELVIAMGEKPVGVSDYPGGFPPYLSALNDVPILVIVQEPALKLCTMLSQIWSLVWGEC